MPGRNRFRLSILRVGRLENTTVINVSPTAAVSHVNGRRRTPEDRDLDRMIAFGAAMKMFIETDRHIKLALNRRTANNTFTGITLYPSPGGSGAAGQTKALRTIFFLLYR